MSVNKELLSKSEYILGRLEKAVYMGFILDRNSNEYLGKEIKLDFKMMERCISNYNKSISRKGYPIQLQINYETSALAIRCLGEFLNVNSETLSIFIEKVEARIFNNLKHACESYTDEGIEIFDLDLLVELKRTGVTTMGDTYQAYNGKKYKVNFSHLYNIVGF